MPARRLLSGDESRPALSDAAAASLTFAPGGGGAGRSQIRGQGVEEGRTVGKVFRNKGLSHDKKNEQTFKGMSCKICFYFS